MNERETRSLDELWRELEKAREAERKEAERKEAKRLAAEAERARDEE